MCEVQTGADSLSARVTRCFLQPNRVHKGMVPCRQKSCKACRMTVDSSYMCGNIRIAFPLHVVLQLFSLYVLSVFFNPFYLSFYQQKPNRTLNSNNKINTVSQKDLNRSYALRYLVAINVMSSEGSLLTSARLVQEFHPVRPGLSATSVFTRASHVSLSWANWIQSALCHHITLRFF